MEPKVITCLSVHYFHKTTILLFLFQSFVPEAGKDGKYWEKREKNNVAARRSREARRLKENQIALRTAYLEKENNGLRVELDQAKSENLELLAEKQLLLEKLKQYE